VATELEDEDNDIFRSSSYEIKASGQKTTRYAEVLEDAVKGNYT